MQADEIKILTHLFHRRSWIDIAEIEKAWKFDDFDKAFDMLVDKGFLASRGTSCRITPKGIEVLKEV